LRRRCYSFCFSRTASTASVLKLISYLKAILDAHMRRCLRILAWYLMLVVVLGILTMCESLRDLERFSLLNQDVLTEPLSLQMRHPSSDSSFRYVFLQVNVATVCAAIREWTIARIPDGTADLDQLVCVPNTLQGTAVSCGCFHETITVNLTIRLLVVSDRG
jgi:hypothetical protein